MEFFYDSKKDRLTIIEINPRLCYQFADLHEKIYGINTYRAQFELSLGRLENLNNMSSKYSHAGAFALRTFEDKKIKKLPSKTQIDKIHEMYPDSKIIIFGQKGRKLSLPKYVPKNTYKRLQNHFITKGK